MSTNAYRSSRRQDNEQHNEISSITENNTMSTTANTPRCPNCGQSMKLARVTPRVGGLPELQSFECRPCGVVFTEAVEDLSARPNAQYQGG
jgi:transposase-like protein